MIYIVAKYYQDNPAEKNEIGGAKNTQGGKCTERILDTYWGYWLIKCDISI